MNDDISYKYLPVSVFDVAKLGKKTIRKKQNHYKNSSRNSYSPFPLDIAEWCSKYFLRDASVVFDPFAGWGERNKSVNEAGKLYIGYDISEKAIKHAKEHFDAINILGDSRIEEIPEHDGLLTCPPYWNLEKYEKDGIDREKSWEGFLEKYEKILSRAIKNALPEAKYCIMVGDWRKNHKFYDLTFQTEKILQKHGMKPFDKVILSYKKISPIKLMLPQAKRLGYTVKVHQTLLIYKK